MAERADLFIHPRQGTDYVWLAGITKYIIDQDWHDKKFIAENVKNFDEYSTMLEKYTLDYTEEITGISKENLKEMARMVYEADGTCILWGMGVTQNTGGSTTSAAISNLLLVTGNYRRPVQAHIHYEVIIMYKVLVIWRHYQTGFGLSSSIG